MKNDTTFVRMRRGDNLGDAKMLKTGTSLFFFFFFKREPCPDSQIESVWVEIKRQGEPLLIGCIYRPPSASVGAWLQFEDQVETGRLRFRPKSDVILTGDFNVDFLDPTHPHLPHLKHFLATFNLLNHTTAPTRISTQRNSCLDLFITSEDLPVQSSNPFPAENINTDPELILSSLPKTSQKGYLQIKPSSFQDKLQLIFTRLATIRPTLCRHNWRC